MARNAWARADLYNNCRNGDLANKISVAETVYLLYIVTDMASVTAGAVARASSSSSCCWRCCASATAPSARRSIARSSRAPAATSAPRAVYVTLDRLEAKRMVCSYVGTPSRQRGGRRRKHYLLDTAGQRALLRAYRTFLAMIGGMQQEFDALALSVSPPSTTLSPDVSADAVVAAGIGIGDPGSVNLAFLVELLRRP